MKKIIAILLAITCVLSFSACSTSSTATYTAAWGKADVLETSTYSISVVQGTEPIFEGAPEIEGDGTYVVTISGSDAAGYVLETILEFSGSWIFGNSTQPFEQTITSKVVFDGVTANFAPSYSEKTYQGTTLEYDLETESFSAADLEYVSKITYDNGDAIVTIADFSGNSIATGINTQNTVDLGKSTVYDNEQIFMFLRAFEKSSDASITFDTMNAVTGLAELYATVGTQSEDTDSSVTMEINGKSETLDTFTVNLSINSQFESGSTTILLYGQNDTGYVTTSAGNLIEVDRSRLLSFMHQVPYTSSAFLYNMVEYTSNVG